MGGQHSAYHTLSYRQRNHQARAERHAGGHSWSPRVKTRAQTQTCPPKLIECFTCVGTTARRGKRQSVGTDKGRGEWDSTGENRGLPLWFPLPSAANVTPSPASRACWQDVCVWFCCWGFRMLCHSSLSQREAGQRGGWGGERGCNFARQALSIMIHHPMPGGPQTGRGEKATVTVINGEERIPGDHIMGSPGCFRRGGWWEWRGRREKAKKDAVREREAPTAAVPLHPSDHCEGVCGFLPSMLKRRNTPTHTLANFVLLLRIEQHIRQKVQLPLLIPNSGKGSTPTVI